MYASVAPYSGLVICYAQFSGATLQISYLLYLEAGLAGAHIRILLRN